MSGFTRHARKHSDPPRHNYMSKKLGKSGGDAKVLWIRGCSRWQIHVFKQFWVSVAATAIALKRHTTLSIITITLLIKLVWWYMCTYCSCACLKGGKHLFWFCAYSCTKVWNHDYIKAWIAWQSFQWVCQTNLKEFLIPLQCTCICCREQFILLPGITT